MVIRLREIAQVEPDEIMITWEEKGELKAMRVKGRLLK